MQWYEAEVRGLEEQFKQKPPQQGCTAFYGSSTIRLWSTLQQDLHMKQAVNVGFGGSTLAACVHFFKRLVPPLHPAALVVYAGDNDLGDGCGPEQVFEDFRKLASMTEQDLPEIPVGFISIKLSPSRLPLRDKILRANALIEYEISRRPLMYYIDVYHAMLNEQGNPRAELFENDGLHLSRQGYAVWTRVLRAHRNQMFTSQLPGYAEK